MVDVNLFAVALAALAAFFLGFVWYTVVFAKPWQKEIGMTESDAKDVKSSSLAKSLVGSLILEVLMAFLLAYFIGRDADAVKGLLKGLAFGLVFVGGAFGVNYLFEGKTIKHWLINVGYNVVVFGIMGLIIGAL